MATKKQKREAAKEKHDKFMADERARGLAAQQAGNKVTPANVRFKDN